MPFYILLYNHFGNRGGDGGECNHNRKPWFKKFWSQRERNDSQRYGNPIYHTVIYLVLANAPAGKTATAVVADSESVSSTVAHAIRLYLAAEIPGVIEPRIKVANSGERHSPPGGGLPIQ